MEVLSKSLAALLGALLPALAAAQGAPLLMSEPWAKAACEAWNQEPALTDGLESSGWVHNDAKRGFKLLEVYRTDCASSPRAELRIAEKDGKARCVYGGKAEGGKLDSSADYVMHAQTVRWQEMGRGEYGPMHAMFFQYLLFDGPMREAMSNMGPFESFLRLVGKVPADGAACPR